MWPLKRKKRQLRSKTIAHSIRLGIECLDGRTLPSVMGAGFHRGFEQPAAETQLARSLVASALRLNRLAAATSRFAAAANTTTNTAEGTTEYTGHHCHEGNVTQFTGTLSDPTGVSTATGSVNFKTYEENGETETEFSVSVQGADPSTSLDVAVDSVVVGQIQTDANGDGTLKLSSNADGTTSLPIPADFPAISDGTVVTVGPLTTTLAASSADEYGHHGLATGTRLSADLSDPTGADTTTGTAKFRSVEVNGESQVDFQVSVTGAAADSTLDVAIDGVTVGQISTDTNGAGKLALSSDPNSTASPLPAGFPTANAGSVVTVGTNVTGTLGTVTSTHGFARLGGHHRHRRS